MELRRVDFADIAALREEHRRSSPLAIQPVFYARLVGEARPFLFEESPGGAEPPVPAGYALLLERPHAGHSHVTVVELYLTPDHETRYEDALDLLKETQRPSAYVSRTDDCRFNATLLARGHQVEATALVMLREDESRSVSADETPAESQAATSIGLAPLTAEALPALKSLVTGEYAPGSPGGEPSADDQGPHSHGGRHHHHGGLDPAAALVELEVLGREGHSWLVVDHDRPVAVIARRDGGDGVHELLDFAVARAPEADLARALLLAGETIARDGRRPAAVIDATEAARRRIFRKAGYYSAAAYMVFYDPVTGRPSVGLLTLADLLAMMERKEHFRLVDVLGEEHWRGAHVPGSEWIDFRGLARESRRRFKTDEPIVVYCDGFT